MARQKINPVYIPADGTGGNIIPRQVSFLEEDIQALVHHHPEMLPIGEIDPAFEHAVAICRELSTPAGRIDNLLLTPTGLPVIVECKLWRNPQARREVVGQILDYAKELARFTSADLAREAAKRGVPSIFERVKEQHPSADETSFHDTLTRSLARGRFLLLIVGDGISANVEAIFEQLAAQGALHFSFGLVEAPIFDLPDGARLAVPRVVAKTSIEVRKVVELPAGYQIEEDEVEREGMEGAPLAQREDKQGFWTDFLVQLRLDDPEQPLPKPAMRGWITFSMPVPGNNSWITVWRDLRAGEVGLFLSFRSGSVGQRVAQAIAETSCSQLLEELGGTASVIEKENIPVFMDKCRVGDFSLPKANQVAIDWLCERVNRFINVLRPVVRSIAADIEETD